MRPMQWIDDPSGESPGVVGIVACLISERHKRGGPIGGTATTVHYSEGRVESGVCLAHGSQADNDNKMGCSLQDDLVLVPAIHNMVT